MITVELKGRLGNHLFQYVICRIVAEKNGYEYSIPDGVPFGDKSISGGWLGKKLFSCSMGGEYKNQPNVFKEKDNSFTMGVFNVVDNTHIDGWWQSEKYFYGWEEKIKEWYKMDDIDIDDNICVIHLRAQDGYLVGNHLLPVDYFISSKEKVKEMNGNVEFLIVTDNIEMGNKYFPDDRVVSNDMKTDFGLIKSAKYKIISNSSFSWWAAWLGLTDSELVIAPDRWMNYNYNRDNGNTFYPLDIKTKKFIYL